jgi:hypothetical protein
MSVPVSIGNAVAVYACVAARKRSQPCSSFSAIISTAMIASSTSRPSAMMSAPSEMRCSSMSSRYMARKVSASTSGMHSATTKPVRMPSEKKLTTSTIATASKRLFLNSCTDSCTTRGWSDTAWTCTPTGRLACTRCTVACSCSPRRITSLPLRMLTARPTAGCPLWRMVATAGSTMPRFTSAMSPRRNTRSPARMPMLRMLSTESNSPLTVRRTCSDVVCTVPAASTALVCASVAAMSDGSMPSEASLALDASTYTFSSCAPTRSTLLTSATRRNSLRAASAWSRSSASEKPSPVSAYRLPKVSPNSSLKNGPRTPCGSVCSMSPSFLRTWYHTSGTACGGVDSRRFTLICVTPGLA